MTERTCLNCGADISARNANTKFCGKRCRHVWAKANETRPCAEPGCDRKLWARGFCSTHYNRNHYPDQKVRHRKREVSCVVCGKVVLRRVDNGRLDSHCCSAECRRKRQLGEHVGTHSYDWNSDAKQRARNLGCLVVEDVDRGAVMERDDWRCYLCDKDTSLVTDPFSPDSATVDHVVALTNGGEHSMRNVRCCCLACNASKANRDAVSHA